MNPLEKAVSACGTQRALAEKLGVSAQALTGWMLRGQPPATRVLAIEAATGVSRHELRPDIYPPEDKVKKEAVA